MKIRRLGIAVCTAAAVALLAACGTTVGPTPSPTPTVSASGTPTPTRTPGPTPTPTPVPTAVPESRPALSELVLTTGGLGPLMLGTDPYALDPQTAIIEVLPGAYCEGDPAERWTAAYPERPLGNELRAFEIGRFLPGERVEAIQVFDPLIRTAVGLGPGMTLEQLTAIYPAAEYVRSGAGRDQYLLEQDEKGPLFADVWVAGMEKQGIVSSVSIGRAPGPSYHPLGSCGMDYFPENHP